MEVLTLALLRRAIPFVIAVGVGFSAAWFIQGVRVTDAKNATVAADQALTTYKQAQVQAALDAKDLADKAREESAKIYATMSEALNDQIKSGEVYKRCVAAGKCGVVRYMSCAAGIRLPASGGGNDSSADTVPAGQETATADYQLANDCAIATLRANRLQLGIAGQPGY